MRNEARAHLLPQLLAQGFARPGLLVAMQPDVHVVQEGIVWAPQAGGAQLSPQGLAHGATRRCQEVAWAAQLHSATEPWPHSRQSGLNRQGKAKLSPQGFAHGATDRRQEVAWAANSCIQAARDHSCW